jgi:cell division protein FtsI (penicillin-binding protein 3)
VVSEQTARTVRDMFRAVTQSGPGEQAGTGPQAAVAGYQISGKTGTAQQIDPGCSCYSNSRYWITFAGILPADDPRYVIAIMLDAPSRGVLGASAAPLFHDIASWLVNRDNIPPSAPAAELVLQAR